MQDDLLLTSKMTYKNQTKDTLLTKINSQQEHYHLAFFIQIIHYLQQNEPKTKLIILK